MAADHTKRSKTIPSNWNELNFADFRAKLVNSSFTFYKTHPEIARMINWQRLEASTNQSIRVTLSHEMLEWINIFNHYQQRNEIKKDIKLEFVITLILSIVSSVALDNYTYLKKPDQLNAYLKFVCESIIMAIKS